MRRNCTETAERGCSCNCQSAAAREVVRRRDITMVWSVRMGVVVNSGVCCGSFLVILKQVVMCWSTAQSVVSAVQT